jgi:hypothetical protein
MSDSEKGMEKDLAELEAQSKKLEKARQDMEKMIQEKKAKAAEMIPRIQQKIAEQDKMIAEATAERGRLLGQLKLFGITVKGVGAKGALGKREGGKYGIMSELVQGVGVGGTLTNADIQDKLGSSGYTGMIIADFIEKGYLKRTGPGTYEVTGIPA